MLTITSYFCFLLATLTITLVIFIGVNKIRLIYQARKSVGTLIK